MVCGGGAGRMGGGGCAQAVWSTASHGPTCDRTLLLAQGWQSLPPFFQESAWRACVPHAIKLCRALYRARKLIRAN